MRTQKNLSSGKTITACVTGASGQIGRRLVQKLMVKGYQVRVLTRGNYVDEGVQIFKAGLSDEANLEQFICGADMVFHCAAELKDESKMQEVNVHGTERIVKLVRRYCIRYYCHLSSAGVVGRTTKEWVDESTPCRPQNTYERTKLEAEAIACVPIKGCTIVILRPTNVVDEVHLGELSLPATRSFNSRLKVFIKGAECAHIVHAEDVAEAAIYFSERTSQIPTIFFISLDDDPLNTVANLWSLYRNGAKDYGNIVIPVPHLPVSIPYLLRRMFRQSGNSGRVKYSSKRLAAEGFKFRFGVREAVKKIILDRISAASCSGIITS